MDLETLKETDIWQLYSEAQSYARLIGMYSDTDRNFRMYNGNQWEGVKVKDVELVQLNFIKPIVKFKVGTINQNLWAINFSAENFENPEFMPTAVKVCELLNKKAAKIWERNNMDYYIRVLSKIAAINDEAVAYFYYDKKENMPILEVLAKNDIYYGNENDDNIEKQPYIIIKQRMPVINARDLAAKYQVPSDQINLIVGDMETSEESGESAKYEKDDMVTVLTKLYKKDGKLYYSKATRFVELKKETNTLLELYPVAHLPWEPKEGSARGEGEVRNLIPNQLEVNKTLMRRALVTKNTAYPQKAVNVDNLQNPDAINKVGGILKFKGKEVSDINKVFSISNPAQMSTDVKQLQQDLIDTTRALAGASESATGEVKPDEASGKAILAVQQASQLPLVEQIGTLKNFVESIARIWLNMIITYNQNGMKLEETVTDPTTGQEITQLVDIPASVMQELKASVKVDVTPTSAYDRFAQEVSLENLLKGGWFSPQLIGQLKMYVKALPDNSTMPKQKILEMIKEQEKEQQRIAEINAQSQMMMQQAQTFLGQDPETQKSRLEDAEMQQIEQV
jgi:hypothetical protein